MRVYQPGDDVRTIDWRVTARTQEPHTKLFHEERERPIFIIAEQSQRLFFGSGLCFKSVLAARAAAPGAAPICPDGPAPCPSARPSWI